MEKILRLFENPQAADEACREDNMQLTYQQRFDAFMLLMAPYYAASPRLQRIYRVDDLHQRKIRDDWGIRLQSVPKSKSDR
jgi:hypothetical protein